MSAALKLARMVVAGHPEASRFAMRLVLAEIDRTRRVKAKRAPLVRAQKATKAQRQDNWQRTRAAVLERAGGRCELCGAHGFALDCHHLASGPLRRKYEAPNSVVACCRSCHNGWHKGALVDLQMSIVAAHQIGAPDVVQAALHRRLQKVTDP